MSKEEVKEFCNRFMPSYDAYLPQLKSENVNIGDVEQSRILQFNLDESRTPYVDTENQYSRFDMLYP